MTLALIVWLVMTVFPLLSSLSEILLAVGIGWLVVFGFIFMITYDESYMTGIFEASKRKLKSKVWASLFALSFMCALVPSKETSWYMVGAYATQTVVQSDTAKELASDGVDVLKSLMARAKAEIEPKMKEATE